MKAGIIGLGFISKTHIDAIIQNGIEIVAICDNDPLKLDLARKKLPNANAYLDYKELLKSEKIDVAHICSPHYLHAEMIIESLKNGINCLVEKPLCINAQQYSNIRKAQERSSSKVGVCFQNRFLEANNMALRLLADKKIYGASGVVMWHRDSAYYASGAWRGKWETEGGGVMINQAIHTLDLMLMYLGSPIKVEGNYTNHSLKNVIEVEDTAELFMEFSNGAKGNFFASNACSTNFPILLNLDTEIGLVEIRDNNRLSINSQVVELSDNGESLVGKDYWGKGHLNLVKEFYSCVSSGKEFCINTIEGYKTINVLQQLYKS